jgi:uncharacterized membrane protein
MNMEDHLNLLFDYMMITFTAQALLIRSIQIRNVGSGRGLPFRAMYVRFGQ